MTSIRRHTVRLPDDLHITLLRLSGPATAAALRAMLAVDWYALLGSTASPDGANTGYGAYVGTSDALRAQTLRAGVSLRTWTYKHGRLRPDAVVLIRRTRCPVGEHSRLLVEAAVARAISAAGYTVLNVRTAAPTAASRATRRERQWANHVADRLARLIRGRTLHAHPPAAAGGNTREQLVPLALSQDPPRGMDIDDLLHAANRAGIHIAGASQWLPSLSGELTAWLQPALDAFSHDDPGGAMAGWLKVLASELSGDGNDWLSALDAVNDCERTPPRTGVPGSDRRPPTAACCLTTSARLLDLSESRQVAEGSVLCSLRALITSCSSSA